jgi:hypothetical protein
MSRVLLLILLAPAIARAHGMRTAYLELVEQPGGTVLATWRTTVPDRTVVPRTPSGCTPVGEPTDQATTVLRCPHGLAGAEVAVDGLGPVLSEVVARVVRPDGAVLSRILTRDAPLWVVPVAAGNVLAQYVRLGVLHIATGADHLLFLLGLVLWVRRPRAVLVTETAFTVSHSLTFSATALGWLHVSAAAAEACIALSLVLVALDVGDPAATRDAARRAPLVALCFGLVHGLGFAGGLSGIGLPDGAVARALVGFGLGVELGQVAFLAAALLVVAAAERVALLPRLRLAGSYVVGVTGAWWLFVRLWTLIA